MFNTHMTYLDIILTKTYNMYTTVCNETVEWTLLIIISNIWRY